MDWGRSSRMKRTNSDEAVSSMIGDFDARGQIRHALFQEDESNVWWTDEKHNSYIQSLEATFVQQLHQSGGFISCRTLHHQQFANTHDSSDKFTRLQQSQLNMCTTKKSTRNHGSYHLSRSNAALAEVSDQNFADEQQGLT